MEMNIPGVEPVEVSGVFERDGKIWCGHANATTEILPLPSGPGLNRRICPDCGAWAVHAYYTASLPPRILGSAPDEEES